MSVWQLSDVTRRYTSALWGRRCSATSTATCRALCARVPTACCNIAARPLRACFWEHPYDGSSEPRILSVLPARTTESLTLRRRLFSLLQPVTRLPGISAFAAIETCYCVGRMVCGNGLNRELHQPSMLTNWRGGLAAVLIMATAPALAQGTRVTLTFTPESKTAAFEAAAAEYRSIWEAEGARIIEAMERLTKLRFPQKKIEIQVFEGPSNASLRFNRAGVPVGSRDPMRLRASYSADNKKGTLVHELGHRMNLNLRKRPEDLDEHRLLFLYLYDLYVDLYGREFADAQVAFGRR